MSQVATADAGARGPERALARVPFARLVRVELRKTYDTRAGWWLLFSIGAITLAADVLFLIFGDDVDMTYQNFVGITATPQGFLLPVLGILAITSEWSQRTGLVFFTLEPSRARLLTAKVTAVLILGLIAIGMLLAFAAIANAIGGATGGDGSWEFGAAGVRNVLLLQLMGLLGGVAFGMILLNSAAAIVLSFVLPLFISILFGIIPALEDAAPWIDINTSQQPLFDFQESVSAKEWAQLFVTSLWWIWLPLLAGMYRVMRSEVKSA
jgi:ABC-2 type transport system permease protein